MPVPVDKSLMNLSRRFPAKQQKTVYDICLDQKKPKWTPAPEFVDLSV